MTIAAMLQHARRLLAGWAFWFFAGALVVLLASWWLWHVRSRVIAELSSAQSRAAWQDWKDYTRRLADRSGPVARRPVQSDEPPALVLLRDHFLAVTAGCLVVLTALVGFLAFVVRGMLRGGDSETTANAAKPEPAALPARAAALANAATSPIQRVPHRQ